MFPVWILTLALSGVAADAADDCEPAEAGAGAQARSADEQAPPPRSGRELREAWADLVRRSSRRADPDPEEIVPELVAFYHEVADSTTLSRPEAARLQRGLQTRLEQFRSRLEHQERRRARDARGEEGRNQAERLLAGGGAVTRAAQLIDVIQNTIAPHSWEVNGGQGRITYYQPLKVLVVRQTGEVQHQIGNTLDALRR